MAEREELERLLYRDGAGTAEERERAARRLAELGGPATPGAPTPEVVAEPTGEPGSGADHLDDARDADEASAASDDPTPDEAETRAERAPLASRLAPLVLLACALVAVLDRAAPTAPPTPWDRGQSAHEAEVAAAEPWRADVDDESASTFRLFAETEEFVAAGWLQNGPGTELLVLGVATDDGTTTTLLTRASFEEDGALLFAMGPYAVYLWSPDGGFSWGGEPYSVGEGPAQPFSELFETTAETYEVRYLVDNFAAAFPGVRDGGARIGLASGETVLVAWLSIDGEGCMTAIQSDGATLVRCAPLEQVDVDGIALLATGIDAGWTPEGGFFLG